MSTLEKALVVWVVVFAMPKLLVVPVVRGLLRALADTARQDEVDRQWLAERDRGSDDDDQGWRRRRRPGPPRRPRPGRPGTGRVAIATRRSGGREYARARRARRARLRGS